MNQKNTIKILGVLAHISFRERERVGDLERESEEKLEKIRLKIREATPLSHMRGGIYSSTKLCAPSEL